jgi:hypothetical protein
MSKFIHEIAADVSPLVLAAEEAMEDAVVAIANLMAGAVAKRREAGVLPAHAQPTVLLLHKALTQTIESKSNVLRVHGKLEDQYRTLASDDVHPLTLEGVQRTAEAATRHRHGLSVIAA